MKLRKITIRFFVELKNELWNVNIVGIFSYVQKMKVKLCQHINVIILKVKKKKRKINYISE